MRARRSCSPGQHSSVPLPPRPPYLRESESSALQQTVEQEGSRAAPLPSCLLTFGSSSAAQLLSQETPGRQTPLLLLLLQGIPTGGQDPYSQQSWAPNSHSHLPSGPTSFGPCHQPPKSFQLMSPGGLCHPPGHHCPP